MFKEITENNINKPQFTDEVMEMVNRIISHYPKGKEKSALIPLLHIAQAEFGGWLSVPVMDYIAGILNILPIEVYEVATFYSMFNLKPVGNCVIEVCQTGPCWMNGAEEIITFLENKLNIKAGETTPDGKFTIKRVECLAACGNAPVLRMGEKYYENITTDKVEQLIEQSENEPFHKNPYSY